VSICFALIPECGEKKNELSTIVRNLEKVANIAEAGGCSMHSGDQEVERPLFVGMRTVTALQNLRNEIRFYRKLVKQQ
jgi:hypothetical protein